MSREIVDRHHGILRFRSSQQEGHRGTVFTLFLPFEAVTRQPTQGLAADPGGTSNASKV